MGLFSKKPQGDPGLQTALNMVWFQEWASSVEQRKGQTAFLQHFRTDDRLRAQADLLAKATLVVDHDCRSYLQQYASSTALGEYARCLERPGIMPWAVVSLAVSLGPSGQGDWKSFIEDDMKKKLSRFGDIFVDPSIVDS